MKIKEDYKPLPNNDSHNCFGCSPINSSGLQMKFFTNESSVFSQVTVPQHLCGWNNLVHGGVLSTILDEIMSWAAIYLLKRITMTKSMTIDFIRPVYISSALATEGKVLELKGKRDALMEGLIYNEKGDLCARSTGTFSVFSPAGAERLGIADGASLKWFESIFNLH